MLRGTGENAEAASALSIAGDPVECPPPRAQVSDMFKNECEFEIIMQWHNDGAMPRLLPLHLRFVFWVSFS